MIKVPLVNQPRNSVLCGPACLEMIYRNYGIRLSTKKIANQIAMRKGGTSTANLGTHLLKNGFSVKYVVWNSRFFPSEYRKMRDKAILSDLRKRAKSAKKKRAKIVYNEIIQFIENGGVFEPRIIRIEEIRLAMKKKQPPILCIEQNCLYKVGKKPHDSGHFVIPVDWKNDKITLNDPYWKKKSRHKYTVNELMFALYSWRGGVLFIKK